MLKNQKFLENEEDKEKLNENIIIGNINIKENNLNQRIINSFENTKREESKKWDWTIIKAIENEEEIKDCEIYINNKKFLSIIITNFQVKEIIQLNIYLKD